MFTSRLFSSLILVVSFSAIGNSDLSLRANIENRLSSFVLKKGQLKELAGLISEVKEARQKSVKSSTSDRIYVDFVTESLEMIPTSGLKKSECVKVKQKILIEMEPSSSISPTHPGLKETFKILDYLCKI